MITVVHTGDSTIESNIGSIKRCQRVYLQIGLIFDSDKRILPHWSIYFSKPGDFGKMKKISKSGKEKNNKSYVYSCLGVPPHVSLFWMVVHSNYFCYNSLEHHTVSEKCIISLWVKSEIFFFTISIWVYNIPYTLGTALFEGVYLYLIFFWPFVIIIILPMYIKSNLPSILFFGNHHHHWSPPEILSLDSLIHQN